MFARFEESSHTFVYDEEPEETEEYEHHLEVEILDMYERMRLREVVLLEREMKRSVADHEARERYQEWKERTERETEERGLREVEEERRKCEERLEAERLYNEAERRRLLTENLTDVQKRIWDRQEEELVELEQKLERQNEHLEEVDGKMRGLVGEYEERLRKEEEERRRQEEAEAAAVAAVVKEQEVERSRFFDEQVAAFRAELEFQEAEEWEDNILGPAPASAEGAENAFQRRVFEMLSDDEKARVSAIDSDCQRRAELKEMGELMLLKARLKRASCISRIADPCPSP